MAKYAYHRLDSNAKAIRDGLRQAGVSVDPRCPLDWLCGFQGHNFLLEVKTVAGFKRRSPKQQEFLDGWKGQASVVQTLEEALVVVGILTKSELRGA